MATALMMLLEAAAKVQEEDTERSVILGRLFSELKDVREATGDEHAAKQIENAVAKARLSLFGNDGRS
jgi:hypothetical protein